MTSPQKRSFKELQNATTSDEELLQEPWYAINPDEIVMMVENMCGKLITPLQKYAHIDSCFQDVIDAVNRKRKLPDIRQFNVAILGEQGTGKSSVINALLDRGLLDRSGSSKACTSYATILEHKKGASDQTKLSDLTVEFLNEEEIRHVIKEQIYHWTEVYPGHKKARESVRNGDRDEDDEDKKVQVPVQKCSSARVHGATTAKEFFELIFNVRRCVETKDWLEKQLHHTNIEEGNFFDVCYEKTRSRFTQMAKEKKELDLEMRKACCVNVPDNRLWKETTLIKELWPFVKAVTVATGHILLRHGLRLFDLPGYGDTSQLREAVINNFRRESDFEIVVAPFSRLQTSILQDKHINLSIRLKGTHKTILVINKSDALMNEDSLGTQIREINEDPFPSLRKRLERVEDLENSDELNQDDDPECKGSNTIAALLDEIHREATIAYIKHETENVQKLLNSKGIKVFSVSAMAHIASRNPHGKWTHILDEKTAGILELRNFMAKLPAATNYQNYHDHVYVALTELRNEAARPLEQHFDDETYAAMQRELRKQIQSLREELEDLSDKLLDELVETPWSESEEKNIIGRIKGLIESAWTHPHIYASGFSKMLRENGIPVNGKYHGLNMNADLLRTMEDYIDQWYDDMEANATDLAQSVFQPVKALLCRTRSAIDGSSAQLALKHIAMEELRLVSRHIDRIHDMFVIELSDSLIKTYIHFTTEIDICSPIAKEMRPCYNRALDPGLVNSGSGTYSRQRKVLCEAITKEFGTGLRPLLKKVEENIQKRQRNCWKTACEDFITDTIGQLNGFLKTTKQFLRTASYATIEHSQARSELTKLLADFDIDLRDIQIRFENKAEQHVEKKVKHEES